MSYVREYKIVMGIGELNRACRDDWQLAFPLPPWRHVGDDRYLVWRKR